MYTTLKFPIYNISQESSEMNAPLGYIFWTLRKVEETQTIGCCEAGGKIIPEISELAAENDEEAGASFGLNKFLQAEEWRSNCL